MLLQKEHYTSKAVVLLISDIFFSSQKHLEGVQTAIYCEDKKLVNILRCVGPGIIKILSLSVKYL